MANRKILYGYQIIHGDLVIQEEERLTVQNVFTTYLAGLSYQALADRMNADNILRGEQTSDGVEEKLSDVCSPSPSLYCRGCCECDQLFGPKPALSYGEREGGC